MLGAIGLFGSFAATTNLATINAGCTHAHLNATGRAAGRPTGGSREGGKGSWLARIAAALKSLWRTLEQGAPGRFLAKKWLAAKTKRDGVAGNKTQVLSGDLDSGSGREDERIY